MIAGKICTRLIQIRYTKTSHMTFIALIKSTVLAQYILTTPITIFYYRFIVSLFT